MRKLSDAKIGILRVMDGQGLMTPTEIGTRCNKRWSGASSWACRHLKALVDMGLVARREGSLISHPGVAYKILAEGVILLMRIDSEGGEG